MLVRRTIVAIVACGVVGSAQIGNIVVTEAASFQRGVPARGSIAAIFCTGLTGISGIVTAERLPLPVELTGVRVRIGGAQAPLFAVAQLAGYQQINVQVPLEADFVPPGETDVAVEQRGQQTTVRVASVASAGEFFRLTDGSGAFQHAADYTLVSATNPARAGEAVIGYLSGLTSGTRPPVPTGEPAPTDPPATVSQDLNLSGAGPRYQILIGERHIEVTPLFLGLAPGLAGVYQVNFRVPDGLPQGNQPVRIQENTCTGMFGGCLVVPIRVSRPVPMAVQ